ncbi:hypothetical protein DOTSEDRAFT_82585 [Dothistroma septosporum NZE10]|uniref:Uncharacterized protein n=1 Tax=Dothistroma septosporum (strain NZE10 / CBS 128990) TaxID=675120 RepID=N1PDW9_DOTSN|nr:hypothetical protein DOTSEDRAFT_82585 [Dothistroma septosporum NZE10]
MTVLALGHCLCKIELVLPHVLLRPSPELCIVTLCLYAAADIAGIVLLERRINTARSPTQLSDLASAYCPVDVAATLRLRHSRRSKTVMSNEDNHIRPIEGEEMLDTRKLEQIATEFTGESLVIDGTEILGRNFDQVDASVRAILVKKNSAQGAVRIFGKEVWNVVTGPSEQGVVIVRLGEGEYCRLLGTPTIRLFRRSIS